MRYVLWFKKVYLETYKQLEDLKHANRFYNDDIDWMIYELKERMFILNMLTKQKYYNAES